MATLSLEEIKPREKLSPKTSPAAIYKTLQWIFSNVSNGLWLVGGTALSGYYAENRRSDDIDLFAIDPDTFRATSLLLPELKKQGAVFEGERKTSNYHRATVHFLDHTFTVDIVLDENLHRVGNAKKANDGIWVVDIPTLFATKVACLISRCSEKDLYDLDWIFSKIGKIDPKEMIQRGIEIDGGLSVETLLIGLQGATLRKEACHFLLPHSDITVEKAYRKIVTLKESLIQTLLTYEKTTPPSSEARILKQAIKDRRSGPFPSRLAKKK